MALKPITNFVVGEFGIALAEISEAISSLNVDLSVDGVSQITAVIQDPGLRMNSASYFELRELVGYKDHPLYEIASIEIGRGSAAEEIRLECRTRSCQLLKQDKGAQNYGGVSPTQFAAYKAAQVGLKFVGEPSTARKTGVNQVGNEDTDESAWDVLQRLAGDLDFWCFESMGTLFFCSQPFLVGKFGDPIIVTYPPTFLDSIIILELQSLRKSMDDENGATMSIQVERSSGVNLRPGATIALNGINRFDQYYLITNVSYEEGYETPVTVQLKAPVPPRPREEEEE